MAGMMYIYFSLAFGVQMCIAYHSYGGERNRWGLRKREGGRRHTDWTDEEIEASLFSQGIPECNDLLKLTSEIKIKKYKIRRDDLKRLGESL